MRCLTKVRKDFLRYSTWDFSFTIKELHQNDRADTEICLTPCLMLLPAKKSPDTATIPQAPGPVPSLFGCHSVSRYKMTGSMSIRSQLVSFMLISIGEKNLQVARRLVQGDETPGCRWPTQAVTSPSPFFFLFLFFAKLLAIPCFNLISYLYLVLLSSERKCVD